MRRLDIKEDRGVRGLDMSSAVRKFMNDMRERVLDRLVETALDVLHHDRVDGSEVDKYERAQLRQKFTAALKDNGY